MPAAEIIAIGTELLLGEIQDTNTRYLARALRDAGVDLFRTTVVGDNPERIARVIQESLSRAEIVITGGGLGPTVDDPTRLAVALALGVELVYVPELWEQITARFQRYGRTATENNRRQAFIPAGAIPVENPVGTAPAFIAETGDRCVISLPGVPRELETLYQSRVLPYLRQRYDLRGVIKARVLHTAGVGESQVDVVIDDLEKLSNPTVGLLAHAGQVDIRITVKADSLEEADQLIEQTEQIVYERLGADIYGVDEETLDSVILDHLARQGSALGVVESGLQGELARRLKTKLAQIEEPGLGLEKLRIAVDRMSSETPVVIGAVLETGVERQSLSLLVKHPGGEQQLARYYGGPPPMAVQWAVNTALDFLRRNLIS